MRVNGAGAAAAAAGAAVTGAAAGSGGGTTGIGLATAKLLATYGARVLIFGREREEARRFRETTEAYYDQQIRAINARSLFFPFSRAVGFLSNVMMIGVGGYYMLQVPPQLRREQQSFAV